MMASKLDIKVDRCACNGGINLTKQLLEELNSCISLQAVVMQATWHVLPRLIKGLEALLKFLAPAVFHDPSMLLHVQPVLRLNCISQHAIMGTELCHNAG